MEYSAFKASEREPCRFAKTRATGLRARVYFAPLGDELCSFTRAWTSTAMPVYSVLSVQRTIYTK